MSFPDAGGEARAEEGLMSGRLFSPTVTIGLLAMYTSYIIGNVKLKYPHIKDYAEALG